MVDSLDYSLLYHKCDISLFSFKTTKELKPLEQPIGQESAIEAVDFSSNIKQDGYNLFAMGPSGSGKHSTIMAFLESKAKLEATPSDWCYVNNFKNHQKPIAIEFAPGRAYKFRDDIDELIDMLKSILPTVFDAEGYRNDRESINQKYINLQADIFNYLEKEAKKHNVVMNSSSPSRITFVPVVNGKKLSAEEFRAIADDKKEDLKKSINDFESIVKVQLDKVSELNKALQKEFKELVSKTTREAVKSLIDEVRHKYKDIKKIVEYIDALQNDVIHNVQDFLAKPDDMNVAPFMREFYTPSFAKYKVNLFISQNGDNSAPVIYENNPSYQNLIGRIEHIHQVGTLVTDFRMIKSGALHKANGGYLVLDARKLLMKPFAYEELKRVIRSKEVRIESMAQDYSLVSTTSLEPEPIPVNVKIVLIGERVIYYLLYHYDPDFKKLFKVNADFNDEMTRNNENIDLYARMIGTIAKKYKLLPLKAEAVARVIEYSSREVSHSLKLSTHLGNLGDLLKESDYWSRKFKHRAIKKDDIEKALNSKIERENRIQTRLYDLIDEGTVMINVNGEKIGQINALSYISIGGNHFGIPSRITARSRIGKGEMIDVQREVELSGPMHSKGVMILNAYLGSKYAKELPLSLAVSLVFEQSYEFIDGDSASSTELYAIISSICEVPIKQNIAVTGSVNQFGEIQAIGGVNEKIEGFFDICMKKDPKSFYGVIIPYTNIKHLMLKQEVIEAVKKGRFAIYGVKTIDEGISILTGIEAGIENKKGNFPKKSINGMVVERLKKLTKRLKEFSNSKDIDNKIDKKK